MYNANRPEVHDVLRRWRRVTDGYPERVLVGETPVADAESLAAYYGTGSDQLHLAFNFPFISSPLDAPAMRTIVEAVESALPEDAWPAWTGSNHDMLRLATRWADGIEARARVALVMLLVPEGNAGPLSGRRDRAR